MKPSLRLVSLIFSASVVSTAVVAATLPGFAQTTQHDAKPSHSEKIKIAPADEYFGKLKMSILGIANTIKDQGLKYERQPEQLANVMNSINFAIDAIHDWEHKYPKDPWVAKSLFALERFYEKIDSEEGRAHAKSTMIWLVHDFPDTSYGRTGKKELAEGKVGAPPAAAAPAVPASIDITKPVLGDASPPPQIQH